MVELHFACGMTAIEGELAYFQSLKFGLSEEEMLFFLRQFLEPDNDWQAYKRRIINSFINQVFLYNDHFLVYYNIQKDGAMDFNSTEINESPGFDELSLGSVLLWQGRQLPIPRRFLGSPHNFHRLSFLPLQSRQHH